LAVFKSPEKEFNANSVSKEIGITPMGALKIMKRLHKDGILAAKVAGKATFYRLNHENNYAKEYLQFILRMEAEQSLPYIKRWVSEARKLKSADIAIIFGSVLKKGNEANDIDVMAVTTQDRFEELKKEVSELNKINEKKMHVVYQSPADFKGNMQKQDKIVLNAIKGTIAFGEKKLIKLVL
ncbi:MAG: hypothetical protein HZB66_01795, partial [Candidatus Aenigmarchaeota archaeon]|nr:hypothetical protein [Candidatus Aenigmarchaeota archaeon]